jgi:hypothetical protein
MNYYKYLDKSEQFRLFYSKKDIFGKNVDKIIQYGKIVLTKLHIMTN